VVFKSDQQSLARNGKVFSAEALIRWHHPDKGMIPPLDFLPIIDGTELEIELGN